MRIAIVNDMPMALEVLRRIICDSGEHQVAWLAKDGTEAVQLCNEDRPDLVLMDLVMPVMNGVVATRLIMEQAPCPILLVTSSVEGHSSMVFEAMGAGALDAVNTPLMGVEGEGSGKRDLLAKIKMIGMLAEPSKTTSAVPFSQLKSRETAGSKLPLVAIGSSSGGPQALMAILSKLPADFCAAIVIVQHVDEAFASSLASWLNGHTALSVAIAQKGDSLRAGNVYLAGTNDHLIITPELTLEYTPEPTSMVYRPSVDVFYESAVTNWHGEMLAVLLTGMGGDGATGMLHLKQKGVDTIAQNEQSCAVYGMPKAAIKLGAAKHILALDEIPKALMQYFSLNENRSMGNSSVQ